jgi:alpha-tubulin suppressor-like RCC1 family protein
MHTTIAAAENYSVSLDSRGRVLIWGRPGWLEPHGTESSEDAQWPPLLPTVAVLDPQCVHTADGLCNQQQPRIKAIAASRHAVFALTVDGQMLYTQVRWSSSNTLADVVLLPLVELAGKTIAQISTRFGQVFATTEAGAVYAWGMKSGSPDQPLHACSMGFGEICTVVHPKSIPGFDGVPGSTPIRFIAVGVSHTVFVSIYGEVYSVGRNDASKLGLGKQFAHVDHVLTPQKVHVPGRLPRIVSAAAGMAHTLLLSNGGEVWGCGHSGHGALPCTAESIICTPRHLDKLDFFCTAMAAGINCSFFVSEKGDVYFTGQARQTAKPFRRPLSFDSGMPWHVQGLREVEQVTLSMELSRYQWEHALFTRRDGSIVGWGHMGHGEFANRTVYAHHQCYSQCHCQDCFKAGMEGRSHCRSGFSNDVVLIRTIADAD